MKTNLSLLKYDFTFVGGHSLTKAKQLRAFAKALKKAAGLERQPKFADVPTFVTTFGVANGIHRSIVGKEVLAKELFV